jgi:PIN domain nuclease of toxin-antitoxin system
MSAISRFAAQRKRQHARLQELQQQINAYKGKLPQALNAVANLSVQLQRAMRQASTTDQFQSPSERIYIDIIRNHGRELNGRRYSLETLLWARERDSISPQVWRVVR